MLVFLIKSLGLHCPRRLYSRRRGYIAFSRVCLFVCSLWRRSKRKTAWAIDTILCTLMYYSIAVARHALTQRSKGQRSRSHGYENRHGRTVPTDACCYGRVLLLPAWVCMSIRLPMFSIVDGTFHTHSTAPSVFSRWSNECQVRRLIIPVQFVHPPHNLSPATAGVTGSPGEPILDVCGPRNFSPPPCRNSGRSLCAVRLTRWTRRHSKNSYHDEAWKN